MSGTKYELYITGECRRNLKLCKKRGLPMQELWDVVARLLRGEALEAIAPTSSRATERGNGNATSNPIGCSYGSNATRNSSSSW